MGQILNKFCPPPKKRKTKQWESRVTELLNFLFLISWESKFYRNSFSLSLFVMLVTNSIFFSFLKKKKHKNLFYPRWLWSMEHQFGTSGREKTGFCVERPEVPPCYTHFSLRTSPRPLHTLPPVSQPQSHRDWCLSCLHSHVQSSTPSSMLTSTEISRPPLYWMVQWIYPRMWAEMIPAIFSPGL